MLTSMTVRATLIAIACAMSLSAHAIADPPKQIDIPAGDLRQALLQASELFGADLVYETEQLKGLRTKGVSGNFSAHEAITKLLEGTPLQLRTDEASGAILITTPTPSGPATSSLFYPSPGIGEGGTATRDLRLSQNSSPGMGEDRSSGKGVGERDKDKDSSSPTGEEESTNPLDEIIVIGTHIRGVKDIASPSIIITREDIDSAGFQTVEQLIESLPQNFVGVHPAASSGVGATNASRFASGTFSDHSTGIDLRGLGADSTLVLLNGKRRAAGGFDGRFVDISTIPLAAIERVEIISGGASALYGSDAVAGVVNYVTRRNFDGMQTQISYGGPTEYGGGERLQANHILGHDFGRGSIVAGYEYRRDEGSNFVDLGLFPDGELSLGETFTYLPFQSDLERNSAFFSGRLALADRIELYADLFYSDKKSERSFRKMFTGPTFPGVSQESVSTQTVPANDLSGSLGLQFDLGRGWSIDLNGLHGRTQNMSHTDSFTDEGFRETLTVSDFDLETKLSMLSAVSDGPLFSVGGVTPKAAFGVEIREELWTNDALTERTVTTIATGAVTTTVTPTSFDDERTIRSAFGELRFPFVEDGAPGFERLELTLGARHDSYSDVGDSFNWTSGLIWQFSEGLTLRGAYATSFHAPAEVDRVGTGFGELRRISEPATGTSATSPVLFIAGSSPATPEEAVGWSASLDYAPSFAQWAKVSLSYISIDYDNRIGAPMTTAERLAALVNEARYPGLINRGPSAADVAEFFDGLTSFTVFNNSNRLIDVRTGLPWVSPAGATNAAIAADLLAAIPDLILVDRRTTNIATETYRGLDLNLDTRFDTKLGQLNFGVNATHMLERDAAVTPTSEPFSQKDVVGRPADLRLRGSAGWKSGPWGAFLYLNYVDGYANPFSTPVSTVGSWTTADLTLRFNGAQLADDGWLPDVDASLSVNNLFNEAPPPVVQESGAFRLSYDPANASPVGRFVTLNVTKRW